MFLWRSNQARQDRLLLLLVRSCAAVASCIVVLISIFLVLEALPAVREVGIGRFFSDVDWHPLEGMFGLMPMVWGTMSITLGAVLVAAPVGIGSAIFCHYYAPPVLASAFRRVLELLAGIPSVVYGFWGLVTLVPWIARIHPPGQSLLAGMFILAIMILPTIALMADASFANVPREYITGAAALGLSHWATVRSVVLPATRSGLFTGVILGMGRAIGETMAVLMVCGNVVKVPASLFDPMRTLTANIALEMAFALGVHRSALYVSGLLLVLLVGLLVVGAEVIRKGSIHG